MALHDPAIRTSPAHPPAHNDDFAGPRVVALDVERGDARLLGLTAIGRLLGHERKGHVALVREIDALIAGAGFPRPLPYRTRGGAISQSAHKNARWLAASFYAWLAQTVPAELAPVVEDRILAAARGRLDANAAAIAAGLGSR